MDPFYKVCLSIIVGCGFVVLVTVVTKAALKDEIDDTTDKCMWAFGICLITIIITLPIMIIYWVWSL